MYIDFILDSKHIGSEMQQRLMRCTVYTAM